MLLGFGSNPRGNLQRCRSCVARASRCEKDALTLVPGFSFPHAGTTRWRDAFTESGGVCPTFYVPTEGFPRKLEVKVRSAPGPKTTAGQGAFALKVPSRFDARAS